MLPILSKPSESGSSDGMTRSLGFDPCTSIFDENEEVIGCYKRSLERTLSEMYALCNGEDERAIIRSTLKTNLLHRGLVVLIDVFGNELRQTLTQNFSVRWETNDDDDGKTTKISVEDLYGNGFAMDGCISPNGGMGTECGVLAKAPMTGIGKNSQNYKNNALGEVCRYHTPEARVDKKLLLLVQFVPEITIETARSIAREGQLKRDKVKPCSLTVERKTGNTIFDDSPFLPEIKDRTIVVTISYRVIVQEGAIIASRADIGRAIRDEKIKIELGNKWLRELRHWVYRYANHQKELPQFNKLVKWIDVSIKSGHLKDDPRCAVTYKRDSWN